MSSPDRNCPPSSDLIYPDSYSQRVPLILHNLATGKSNVIHPVPPRRAPKPFRGSFIARQWDKDTAALARQSRLMESLEAARHRRSMRVCSVIATVCAIGAVLALIVAVISSLAI